MDNEYKRGHDIGSKTLAKKTIDQMLKLQMRIKQLELECKDYKTAAKFAVEEYRESQDEIKQLEAENQKLRETIE